MLVLGAVLCWADDRFVESRRRQVLLAALFVLIGFAHLYALLIAPVLILVSALSPRTARSREVRTMLASSVVALLVLTPFIVVVAQRAHGQGDPPPVTPANMAEELLRLPVGVLSPRLAVPTAIAVLALAAVGVGLGYRRGGRPRRGAVLATVWLGLPIVTLCLFQAVTGSPGLVTRYWLFCLPALAVAAGLALDALSRRYLPVAIAVVAIIGSLGLPTQVAVRTENGHLGQRWPDLGRVLTMPGLVNAALLAEGWTYRGVVSNDPSLATRMPLVVDPAATGRVNPEIAGPDSEAFRTLIRDYDAVVALQADEARPPPCRTAARSGRSAQNSAATDDRVAVRLLRRTAGRVHSGASSLSPEARGRLAASIIAIEPDQVRCMVP